MSVAPLFLDLELISDPDAETPTFVLPVCNSQSFTGLQLGGVFADDPVLAVGYQNEEVVAIHTHNFNHNGFIYIPYTQQALADATSPAILNNAIMLLAAMKSPVTPAPAPAFSLEYDYQSTKVTITDTAPRAEIFYTLDGSDPTEESIPYTGPFTVRDTLTVRAVARGDGYLLSQPSEKLVDIQQVCPLPTFSMDSRDGQTTVTISSDVEGAKIYYNYKGANTSNQSTLYTQPIVLASPRTIYAYQICDGYLNSKLASAEVNVKNPHVRIDVLSHMDANQEQYFALTNPDAQSDNMGYFFPWGNTKPCRNNSSDAVVDFKNGWSLRSRGQHVAWEGINATLSYGDATAFNPVTVDDENTYLPVSSGLLNLSDWNTSAQASARIQTTQSFAGPFDVVAYIVNENGNIGFGDSSQSEWTATAADGCDMGSTITLDGVVVTLGSPNDTGVTWTWHNGNAGLLPSQMPSTEGTAETVITTFQEEAPFGDLPQHGAFLKIEPTKAGSITISGKASANAAQQLVFVTCDKNNPQTIVSATLTPWNNSETQWTYDVDADHVYYFFQLSFPEKLTAFRFTLRGIVFESASGPDTPASTGDNNGAAAPQVVIEVASSDAEGAEWTQLGEALLTPSTYRLYNMHVRSYEGTAPVFVRARIEGGVSRAGVLDIYLANEGEASKQILQQQTDGITEVQPAASLPAGFYSLNGERQGALRRGLNIIVSADGSVKKVFVR